MNARIKAVGVLGFIFVGFSCFYYEVVIQGVATKKVLFKELHEIRDGILTSNNANFIVEEIAKSD